MSNMKKSVAATVLGSVLAAAPADAAPVAYTDAAAIIAELGESYVETFESVSGSVAALDFGPITADVSTSGTLNDQIIQGTDGFGAVAHEGSQFWKLMGGTTTIDLGPTTWEAFGFWYSDLEAASLIISMNGDDATSFILDDDNPNETSFFGFLTDSPFSWVSIAWSGTNGDGVGFDNIMVGRRIPAPGSGALVAVACVCAVGMRGTWGQRDKRSDRASRRAGAARA